MLARRTRAALVAAFSLLAALAPAGAAAAAGSGPCTDPDGVTVVVDATALDGTVDVSCAPDAPATGTGALESAGFTTTRDASGFICAVGGRPDPCPAEFTGEYWSYWYVADGAWVSYQEGSDTAVPTPGGAEGWAWGDGATPPDADPADVVAAAVTSSPETSEDTADTTDPAPSAQATLDATDTVPSDEPASSGISVPPIGIAAGVIAVGLVVATVVMLRRRQDS